MLNCAVIFKDIITSEYLPSFYVLMSNKAEILYNLVFRSIKNIITQQDIYNLNIIAITTDSEVINQSNS